MKRNAGLWLRVQQTPSVVITPIAEAMTQPVGQPVQSCQFHDVGYALIDAHLENQHMTTVSTKVGPRR